VSHCRNLRQWGGDAGFEYLIVAIYDNGGGSEKKAIPNVFADIQDNPLKYLTPRKTISVMLAAVKHLLTVR
jgi:hypothetical protein